MSQQQTIVCLYGPTASGKTALSVALAQRLETEIISADSMQIYRTLDIGTAKPSTEERQGVVHHMLDVCQPQEEFSVGRYVAMAEPIVEQLLRRGKAPLIVGGTGLYLDALAQGNTFSGLPGDESIRARLQQTAQREGPQALHERLRAVDPDSAQRIHKNNVKRVVRALEVWELTGQSLTQLCAQQHSSPRYHAVKMALCPNSRQTLYERIDRRVQQMVEQGLLEEARRVLSLPDLSQTASQAIGYKELRGYLEGWESLEQGLERVKRESRRYAKRQLTWLRRDSSIHWILYDAADSFATIVQRSTDYLARHGV